MGNIQAIDDKTYEFKIHQPIDPNSDQPCMLEEYKLISKKVLYNARGSKDENIDKFQNIKTLKLYMNMVHKIVIP